MTMHRTRLFIGIGAGLLLIPLSLMAASACSEQARETFNTRVERAKDVRDAELDRLKETRDRARDAADRIDDTRQRKARRRAADDAYKEGRQEARDRYKEEYADARAAYSAQKERCRNEDRRGTTPRGSGTGANCQPYICSDGRRFPTCSPEGYPINYFVHPCRF